MLCEATALGRAALEQTATAEKWDLKLAQARQELEADWWKLETERGSQLRRLRDDRLLLEQVRFVGSLLRSAAGDGFIGTLFRVIHLVLWPVRL